jgi:hypothetical protein
MGTSGVEFRSGSSHWTADAANRFRRRIVRGIAFTPQVLEQLWLRTFAAADVTRLKDAGHYLQEDAHERIVSALLAYLQRLGDG